LLFSLLYFILFLVPNFRIREVMNESVKPERHNPNAARPPGEGVQNVTVENTLGTQSATLADGTQISWGNSVLSTEAGGQPPPEQATVVTANQLPEVTYWGDSYNNQSVPAAKEARERENAATGTAQVTYWGGLAVTGEVHQLAPLPSDGRSSNDKFYDPQYVPGTNPPDGMETRDATQVSTNLPVTGEAQLQKPPEDAAILDSQHLTVTAGLTTSVGSELTETQGITIGAPIKIGGQIFVDSSHPPGGDPGSEVINVATVTSTPESGKNPGVIPTLQATPTPSSQFQGLKDSINSKK
jgi:hypothetical protein